MRLTTAVIINLGHMIIFSLQEKTRVFVVHAGILCVAVYIGAK